MTNDRRIHLIRRANKAEAETVLLRLALALAVREVNSAIAGDRGELHADEKWTPDCFREMAENHNPENYADPDALPDVDAGDVESHAGELRTVRRAWVSGVAAEVEDCGNGHYDVILRADRGEDLLHFVGGSPDEGAIHATFSIPEICTLASLLTSYPPISEALRSPSLHPAPPPTPGWGGAWVGVDGDAVKAASDLMADLARENMHLSAEIENLRAQILAIGPRLDNSQSARPRRADGRRRWGSALWAVACRELLIGDVSREGTKYAIWLNDEEEALVRLWVDEYHGREQ